MCSIKKNCINCKKHYYKNSSLNEENPEYIYICKFDNHYIGYLNEAKNKVCKKWKDINTKDIYMNLKKDSKKLKKDIKKIKKIIDKYSYSNISYNPNIKLIKNNNLDCLTIEFEGHFSYLNRILELLN